MSGVLERGSDSGEGVGFLEREVLWGERVELF